MIKEGSSIENREGVNHPNLLKDFDACVEAVIQIESLNRKEGLTPDERYVLKNEMAEAKTDLLERTNEMDETTRERYLKQNAKPAGNFYDGVTGFQGLGGWNRYGVLVDGTITISRSHAIGSCGEVAEKLGVIIAY